MKLLRDRITDLRPNLSPNTHLDGECCAVGPSFLGLRKPCRQMNPSLTAGRWMFACLGAETKALGGSTGG
jgi:hypothetical protein